MRARCGFVHMWRLASSAQMCIPSVGQHVSVGHGIQEDGFRDFGMEVSQDGNRGRGKGHLKL